MSSLPQALDFGTIPDVETMKVSTNVLDPITITQSQAVFQIPKTGILDGGSMVQLAVTGDSDLFFPPQTGIHSLIKSVFLKVGGKVIASSEEYAHYQTAVRQVYHPDHRAYVDMVKSGTVLDRWASTSDGRVVPRDILLSLSSPSTTTDAGLIPEFIKPTSDDSTTPVFSIPLSTLIPMMKSRPLPLFAMKEHVYIEINFNTQSASEVGIICCQKSGSTGSTAVTVSTSNVKFISDHLYYTQERMDAQARSIFSDEGLGFVYVDNICTIADVPAVNVTSTNVVTQKIERKVAVSGKVVRNILISDKPSGDIHNILGDYYSQDQRIPSEINYRINDQRVFDRDMDSVTRQYDEVSKVFGAPLMIPSQMYSFDSDTDKDLSNQALNQNSVFIGKIEEFQLPDATNTSLTNDIRGRLHYDGLDLTKTGFQVIGNGIQVGVKPIIFQKNYKRTNEDKFARKLRIFCAVERQLLLKSGEVIVSA